MTKTLITSLHARGNELAPPEEQIRVLNDAGCPSFDQTLDAADLHPLTATGIDTFQINVGKLCNQTCRHCHVDAGPDRKEVMTRETFELCLNALAQTDIPTVDITGGAPELNLHFRWFVEEVRALGRHVIDRCNLTILLVPSQADLADFLVTHQIEIVASLPSFTASQTDAQRGKGVMDASVEALRLLNAKGYGQPDSPLTLNLVYNPNGAYLPASQESLETRFKREMQRRYGVVFNNLFTITNIPIGRFLEFLVETGNLHGYMNRLISAFNPVAARSVMCRNMLSIGWDGTIFDCDFNQMLDIQCNHGAPSHIRDFDITQLRNRRIVTGPHCYGCTAGAGSSCGGATA